MDDATLSPHFRLSELTVSQTAVRRGLRNDPPSGAVSNLRRLAHALEDVRRALGDVPIIVSSGYRSPKVNSLVGGSPNSLHLQGLAADFTAPAFGTPRQICQRIIDVGLVYEELIFEGAWVHFALAAPGAVPQRKLLTAIFLKGGPARYVGGLL